MKSAVMASLLVSSLLGAAHAANGDQDLSAYPLGERSIFSDRAVAERIKPVGTVCVEGEDCGTEVAAAEEADSGPRSGEEIHSSACSSCHATGAAGAPVTGDAAAWSGRIGKGMDTLVQHAWEGFNAMPAKGMCMDCSEEEIRATVEYMVDESR